MIDEFLKIFGIIFIVFMLVKFKFPYIIKLMENIDKSIENFMDNNESVGDVENKRKRTHLIHMIKQGETSVFPGKTKWTVVRLQKASNKRIETLYNNINVGKVEGAGRVEKDIMSKLGAMEDFSKFQKEYKSNFLTSSSNISLPDIPVFEYSPLELVLASIYPRSSNFLPYVSTFCQIFNALDWRIAAEISRKRELEKSEENYIINGNEREISERREDGEIDEGEKSG